MSSRILLLCFIHGFKGSDDTFREFPFDLKKSVAQQLPNHRVESVVYPKYETKGELSQATEAFLEWLKERVLDIRKAHLEKPWPPNDRNVGVVLVAHSMGGFVAADTLFLALNHHAESQDPDAPIFPLIQGILTFDTAYNGLARSMFVYGAFSNYQKVSSVFNVMTALGAAAPAGLSRLAAQRAARSAAPISAGSVVSNPAWKTWQLVAVQTGTVGAIAAGGVAAYMHREAIMKGMKSVRNLNKESVIESYRQGMESLGQGLAYINRGNVGHSFAWLSDHFTFVGALLKQKELGRRLERMAALKGVGIKDFYTSLGENGYWSGGYFVPERTFCAVPEESHAANSIFTRCVMRESEDEIGAHMSMFRPEKNQGYERMTDEAAELVVGWFLSEDPIIDEPKLREATPDEAEEDSTVEKTLSRSEEDVDTSSTPPAGTQSEGIEGANAAAAPGEELPDESPLDIAAAASLVPLPESNEDLLEKEPADVEEKKKTYLQHLFRIAQQTGTGATKGWWPNKMPEMPAVTMPSVHMPSMPSMPSSVASLGQVSIPGAGIFSKKQKSGGEAVGTTSESAAKGGEKSEEPAAVTTTESDTTAGTQTQDSEERAGNAESRATQT